MTSSILEVAGLECVRGHRVLFRDLSCRLESGSMLQICGENGAGKTSLLRLLCGLSLPEAGSVCWNGIPIAKCRAEYHRALAWLGHDTALKGELTPVENIDAATALAGGVASSTDAAPLSTRNALHQMGLHDHLHLPCRVLSAGQQQRVALARILRHPGGIWMLDEPAAALDESAIALLEQMLQEQIARGGMVIFTSHRELTLGQAQPQHLHLEQFQ